MCQNHLIASISIYLTILTKPADEILKDYVTATALTDFAIYYSPLTANICITYSTNAITGTATAMQSQPSVANGTP